MCDEAVDDRGREGVAGTGELEVCDRLIFLVGGGGCCCGADVSVTGEALDTEGR